MGSWRWRAWGRSLCCSQAHAQVVWRASAAHKPLQRWPGVRLGRQAFCVLCCTKSHSSCMRLHSIARVHEHSHVVQLHTHAYAHETHART